MHCRWPFSPCRSSDRTFSETSNVSSLNAAAPQPRRLLPPQRRLWLYLGLLTTTLADLVEQSAWCVCLSVWRITFGLNSLGPRYLACWFFFTPSKSCSKVKVIGQSLRSRDENRSFLAMDALYKVTFLWMHVTYFWLFVEFFVLKW